MGSDGLSQWAGRGRGLTRRRGPRRWRAVSRRWERRSAFRVGAWARIIGKVDHVSGFYFYVECNAWGGGGSDAGDTQDECAGTISDHVVAAVEQFGLHLGGAAGGHGDGAHRALAHMLEDVRLGEVTAEGFAGGANGLRGLELGFAFAGGEQFDGAAGLLGDSAGLVDGLDGRSGLDGGECGRCWYFACHPRSRRVFAAVSNVLKHHIGLLSGVASGRV
jgi:hypothetical protein